MALKSINIENWLQNGALLSTEQGFIHLSEGPFQASDLNSTGVRWISEDFFSNGFQAQSGQKSEVSRGDFLHGKPLNFNGLIDEPRWQQPEFSDFQTRFLEIQKDMAARRLEKVVPVVFESVEWKMTPERLFQLLVNAFQSGTQGHIFGKWDLQRGEGIIGLSPEVLFSIKGSNLNTMALAGTATSKDHSLLGDPKELKEHSLVTQTLVHQLKELGDVQLEGPYEWSLGALTHLRTDIQVKLHNSVIDPYELLKRLHPSPALGGLPRQKSLELLEQWDQFDQRSEFGAPFCFWNSSEVFCVVAIRCLIWKDNRLRVGSGCGIVESSQLELEWNELKKKRQSVKQMFGLL